MRVMHVLPNAGSGIESLVTSMLPSFRAQGLRTDFVYLNDEVPPKRLPDGALESVTVLNLRKAPGSTLGEIGRTIRNHRPDILHTHSLLPSLIARLPAARGIRHIRTVHAPYPYFANHDLRSALKRRLEGWALQSTGAEVVCVGLSVADSLPWRLQRPAMTIANGVTPPSEPLRFRTGKQRLLAVGRLEDQKGYPRLLDAMARVLSEFPDVQLVIAGEGSQRPVLEATIREHGLGRNVTLLGHRTDVGSLYGEADVFVCSSNYEGIALASMEALCSGCSVVSTPITPSREINTMVGAEVIRIADDMTPEALARTISLELRHPSETPEAITRRVTEARDALSIQRCATKYLDLYRNSGRLQG